MTLLSYLLTPLFFLFFGLFLVLFHPLQVITRNLFGARAHDHVVAALNFCLTGCLYILGTRLSFHHFKALPTDRPILFICNHQSMWDIPPAIWMLRKNRPKYIAKASLAKNIPSISYNLKYGGSVAIDRKNTEESKAKIETFAENVAKNNFSIVIYPEGTRSRNGKVAPFKQGGIESILNVIPEIDVVPIAIKNTGLIDNNGKFNKRLGIHASFTMLPIRKLRKVNCTIELEKIRNEIINCLK
ncbi:lysophospholipid acyltransferase family protein [Crocinitomix algicola]|uniref:lysophospholipid acyltransferase family protein n=1 Tax=Crocinitomix algicola TaxID=1740263 RepID=UPI000832B6CA|nr:lysophospholipid acyltransferase family protein [Crocinitomix algicola]